MPPAEPLPPPPLDASRRRTEATDRTVVCGVVAAVMVSVGIAVAAGGESKGWWASSQTVDEHRSTLYLVLGIPVGGMLALISLLLSTVKWPAGRFRTFGLTLCWLTLIATSFGAVQMFAYLTTPHNNSIP